METKTIVGGFPQGNPCIFAKIRWAPTVLWFLFKRPARVTNERVFFFRQKNITFQKSNLKVKMKRGNDLKNI
jgi:hypothetical protein